VGEGTVVGDDGKVTITIKADSGYDAPWLVIRAETVQEAVDMFDKNDGADLLKLMRQVSGAAKAFKATFNNRMPEAKTQGKPEAANTKSPEYNQDPINPEAKDDAPPFGDDVFKPDTPTCKHGEMTRVEHKGTVGYICSSGLPKGDPGRCASVMQ
jgi:hypothetical protein